MRVIIVGVSKVGYALTKYICGEGHDVVVIDKIESRINEITDAFDCNGYVGNGASPSLLKKAGIDSTSLFIAVTKQDEVNLMCCNVAERLGVKRTIAAIRNPEFDSDRDFFDKDMGVDLVFNPEELAALEASKMIRYAGAVQIEKFEESKISIATVNIAEDSILANVTMPEIYQKLGAKILVCAIERENKVIAPKGKHQIKVGDRITFAADDVEMEKALRLLGIWEKTIRRAVVVGGSKVGYYLTDLLLKQGIKVTVVDNDEERCQRFLERFPKANVVNGDGTNSEFMEKELKHADACVSVTGRDEENLIISMFAKSFGMARIATEVDNVKYEAMLRKSGIDHIFSTQNVAVGSVLKDARQMATGNVDGIRRLHTLFSDNLEAVELEVDSQFSLIDVPFKDPNFKLKQGILIAVIVRGEDSMVPDGNSVLKAGDRITVFSAEHKIASLNDILA